MNIRARALLPVAAVAAIVAGPLIASGYGSTQNERVGLAAPLGLPPIPTEYATASSAKVDLGRKVFAERRLSFNNTLSCAMCHLEQDAFASTQSKKAIGMEGRTLRRNAPTLLNVVYQKTLFHDGRERRLDLQVWLPFLAEDEMANPSMGYVLDRLASLDDYAEQFERVYPGEGISVRTVGDAIATFEASLLSGNSRFDRWRFGGDEGALSATEKSGFSIFTGKGRCSTCHAIDTTSALFSDHKFHNTGIGYRAAMLSDTQFVIPLAPGVETTLAHHEIDPVSEILRNDVGRFEVTLQERDRWAYKTPSLRDVSRTPPYMHDGSIATLEEVVEHYSKGGIPHDALSDKIVPLDLSPEDKQDLVAFLRTLDGTPHGSN